MNRTKRNMVLKVLNSGWSAINISNQIGNILNQPEEDILRIIQALHWDKKQILNQFDCFSTARNNIQYVDNLGRLLK